MGQQHEHVLPVEVPAFESSIQHLLSELERIDLLIKAAVSRVKQLSVGDERFPGLVISEAEIDILIARPSGLPEWASARDPIPLTTATASFDRLSALVATRKAASLRHGISLRLDNLQRRFKLTPFDVDALLIALAPEADVRNDRLYAYLQDDVTKRRPSVDLILNLLCRSFDEKLAKRSRFLSGAPLVSHNLIDLFEDPAQQKATLLGKYIKVEDRIVNYLFDEDRIDERIECFCRVLVPQVELHDLRLPSPLVGDLENLNRHAGISIPEGILIFLGPSGIGKQLLAEALCRRWRKNLLTVDGRLLTRLTDDEYLNTLRLISREAVLQDTALYWDGCDLLLRLGNEVQRKGLLEALERSDKLSFLAGKETWVLSDLLREQVLMYVDLAHPGYRERIEIWRQSVGEGSCIDKGGFISLADRFRFGAQQIAQAVTAGRHHARRRDPEGACLTVQDLVEACRRQATSILCELAEPIEPRFGWGDIVLPKARMAQLREVAIAVKHRGHVYTEWGFERKLSLGKGISALFVGPSGTGKTMAAEILAAELAREIFRIDVSSIVSKYIGETEKNLARVFDAAEMTDAILFFDEADALFGKRSTVQDAHDRYANLEVSYLLQRIEQYEGITILATNLRKNMDDAFLRRVTFKVHFTLPEEAERLGIWRTTWPSEMPRAADVDLEFLAARFQLSGGNVRNVLLAAALFAAEDAESVGMGHLIRALKREYQKMGKAQTRDDFDRYYHLVVEDD